MQLCPRILKENYIFNYVAVGNDKKKGMFNARLLNNDEKQMGFTGDSGWVQT